MDSVIVRGILRECFGIRLSGTPTTFNCIKMTHGSRHSVAGEHVTMRSVIILTDLIVAHLRNTFCSSLY